MEVGEGLGYGLSESVEVHRPLRALLKVFCFCVLLVESLTVKQSGAWYARDPDTAALGTTRAVEAVDHD